MAHPISFIHSTAPDYRWEGLAIGAIAVGTLGAVFVLGFCNDPDAHGSAPKCALGAIDGFLFGATIGGVTGGLLGGLIPKGPPKAPPDSTH